jgi:hypothetical protein
VTAVNCSLPANLSQWHVERYFTKTELFKLIATNNAGVYAEVAEENHQFNKMKNSEYNYP